MGLSLDTLDPPLDDVAFLARSNNRVDVLDELAADDYTRRELRDITGISQPTLGRILDGFQERAWVAKNGRTYTLTPFGRLLVGEFRALLDTAGTIQQLRDLAPRLPLDAMDFDIRQLADATVTTPKPTDASAHFRREGELLARTDRVQFLCNQAQPETVEVYRDWVVESEGTLETIIAGDAIDAAIDHPTMREYLHDMLSSDRVAIYRYDGPVSVMLGLLDDVASIIPLDETGIPCAFIESDNETVQAWVTGRLETYREEADRLTLEHLPA